MAVMEWGQPQNFAWFWTVPAVAALFVISGLRRKAQMKRFGDADLVERLLSSLDPKKRLAKRVLCVLALACMVVALAQPHFRKKETLVERKGIDVFIAIDVSNSMLAKDIAPSRLDKAKLELSGLVDRLKGDRIGIIAFAGDAYIQCPLTLDRAAAKLFLSTANSSAVTTQGTVITNAIKAALQGFPEGEKAHRALVLLTDGEDQEGDAVKAAKKAAAEGVKILTVGIGTPEGRTIPDESGTGVKKDSSGRPVISKLNETLLKNIARETGGAYYRSSRGTLEVDSIVRELRGIQPKGMKSEWSIEYEENYQAFVALAIMLLMAEWLVSERRGREESS